MHLGLIGGIVSSCSGGSRPDIAVTKEKTPQGMVYHYVRYGGDESVGSARVCNSQLSFILAAAASAVSLAAARNALAC